MAAVDYFIKFDGIKGESMDLDSVTHLRRLIELNVGDPVLLEEEISFLLQPEKTS